MTSQAVPRAAWDVFILESYLVIEYLMELIKLEGHRNNGVTLSAPALEVGYATALLTGEVRRCYHISRAKSIFLSRKEKLDS
jgi:hypothetical protein